MIMRLVAATGVLLVVGAWLLMVPMSPAPYQASSDSAIAMYRAEGLIPERNTMTTSAEIGHGVFEIPEADATHLAMALADGGDATGMEGMPGMQMASPEGGHAEDPAQPMQMAEGEHAEEPAGKTDMAMAMGDGKEAEGHSGGDGLAIVTGGMAKMASRTVEIEIAEWGFSPGNLTVKSEEVVRFVVTNTGNIPHEFMFMSGAAMSAINYRLERADWNLLEHEAPYERSIVLPGDSFEVVVRIERSGTWMFMCMFPYHMQFGMMGMMMTEGTSMDAGAMGGMKM